MAVKMFESTQAATTMRSSSNLAASIYGNDCLELVWENGQVIVQGVVSSSTTTTRKCLPLEPFKQSRISARANFSNFIRPSVLITKSRDDDIKAAKVTKTANNSKSPDDHSVVILDSSGCLSGNQELLPTKKCEAVGDHDSALSSIHGFSGHFDHNQTSKRKLADTSFCNELPVLNSSSSVCSLGASNDVDICSRKQEEMEDSIRLSDNEEETDVVKETLARKETRVKRSRNNEIHKLYERKQRDKINKKMRVLKELIPNCNKVDKASMLDDAIAYIKTLQLQLKIMSMGTGLCMPLMVLSIAPHQMINASHVPQLMRAGMGFRPCNLPQFPIPQMPAGITQNKIGMFGFPNQLSAMPIPHTHFIPMVGNKFSTQPLQADNVASAQLTTPIVSVLQAQSAIKQATNQAFLHK